MPKDRRSVPPVHQPLRVVGGGPVIRFNFLRSRVTTPYTITILKDDGAEIDYMMGFPSRPDRAPIVVRHAKRSIVKLFGFWSDWTKKPLARAEQVAA